MAVTKIPAVDLSKTRQLQTAIDDRALRVPYEIKLMAAPFDLIKLVNKTKEQ